MFGHIVFKRNAYCATCKTLKKRLSPGTEYGENETLDQLIKDTLICLENDDFENALVIIGKVEPHYYAEPNIELLNMIISQSLSRTESDYEQSLCY